MIVLHQVAAGIFLVLEAIMLFAVMARGFARRLGGTRRDSLRLRSAGLQYRYVVGLVRLVWVPAPRADAPGQAALQGAYELTSMPAMRIWS